MQTAIGSGESAVGRNRSGKLGWTRVAGLKVAVVCVSLLACPVVMSGCASGAGNAAKRANAARGGVAASAVSERIEKRLGPGKRTEIFVWPAPRDGDSPPPAESGAKGGAQ